MYDLGEPDDQAEIPGRGMLYQFRQTPEGVIDPYDLRNHVVLMSGRKVHITGVDRFSIFVEDDPKHPYNLGFGILIKEVS